MLGEAFYAQFKNDYELKCTDKDVNDKWLSFLDFRDFETYKNDVYKFQTDYLFHIGAYTDLESALRHHLNPAEALQNYDPEYLSPDLQETCQMDEATHQAILETLDPLVLTPLELSDAQITDLLAFLQALTSPSAVDLRADIPAAVPSGLPVRE